MTTWLSDTRKARKSHVCDTCRRTIGAGETYMRGVGFDGNAWSWCVCAHCRAVLHLYDPTNCDGEYNADDFDYWANGENDRSEFPASLTEWRHRVGFHWQWRHRYGPNAGQLMPIPMGWGLL